MKTLAKEDAPGQKSSELARAQRELCSATEQLVDLERRFVGVVASVRRASEAIERAVGGRFSKLGGGNG